jgi:hypothetical protein
MDGVVSKNGGTVGLADVISMLTFPKTLDAKTKDGRRAPVYCSSRLRSRG